MTDFTFIDLFAGIGGMRIAFEDLGGECVFSSEIDPSACQVYKDYFGEDPYFDITKIKPKRDLNFDFDILLAGFPCQAFSMAGDREGFNVPKGQLFNYIDLILREKGKHRPKAFLLENVKGLVSHDKGRTLDFILGQLKNAGYIVPEPQVLNAIDYNVPQKRERVYIVGFRDDLGITEDDFSYPEKRPLECTLKSIIQDDVRPKYYLSQGYLDCLKNHKTTQRREGRGFGYYVLDPEMDKGSNTLMTGGMGRERNLIHGTPLADTSSMYGKHTPINSEFIRTLTPCEFSRLQKFPADFRANVADTHAYRLFGNSVAIDVVYYVGLEILKTLQSAGQIKSYTERDASSKKYLYNRDNEWRMLFSPILHYAECVRCYSCAHPH